MHEIKDTHRAVVRLGYDGRVYKQFKGAYAKERFENEVRVLSYLEEKGCDFVPQVLEADPETLLLTTTSCGSRVQRVSEQKVASLFEELRGYGVEHDDKFDRNITYDPLRGRFCVIDFEFATITETGEGFRLQQALKRPEKEGDQDENA